MANRVMWRKKVAELTVTCVRGAAWITWQGSGDYVLEPGQSLQVRGVRGFCLELLRQGDARLEERARDGSICARDISIRSRDAGAPATAEAPSARSFSAA